MGVFEAIGVDTHEEVLFGVDPVSGLKAIIAVHSTALGPALGGTRFFSYDDEDAALADVLRLAKAMTYKAAAAGLDFGGGKAEGIAGYSWERAARHLDAVADTVTVVLKTAEERGVNPHEAAVKMAEERIAAVGTLGLRRRGGKTTK